MEEKPTHFQEELGLVQEEAVTEVLKKACYDNSYVSYSQHTCTTRDFSWSFASGADLVQCSFIGHNDLECFSGSIFVGFFVGQFSPQKLNLSRI